MKRRSRLLIAIVVGALLALIVAVPVVAGMRGTRAQDGVTRMYSYTATETVESGE